MDVAGIADEGGGLAGAFVEGVALVGMAFFERFGFLFFFFF